MRVPNARDLRSANRPDRERSPQIDEDVTGKELDRATQHQIKTLEDTSAEWVARHLVMAGRLLDEEPELAFQHALAASRRGGRLASVREAVGLTASRPATTAKPCGNSAPTAGSAAPTCICRSWLTASGAWADRTVPWKWPDPRKPGSRRPGQGGTGYRRRRGPHRPRTVRCGGFRTGDPSTGHQPGLFLQPPVVPRLRQCADGSRPGRRGCQVAAAGPRRRALGLGAEEPDIIDLGWDEEEEAREEERQRRLRAEEAADKHPGTEERAARAPALRPRRKSPAQSR